MKADITRRSFRSEKHYTRTIQQQGRVPLDADWNEQLDIQRHFERQASVDVIGETGVPKDGDNPGSSFAIGISADGSDLTIAPGHMWVDGTLCENDSISAVSYKNQPDLPNPPAVATGDYVLYLDVWQRHVTGLDDPSILEVALGGADTCTRAKTIWQAKLVAGNCQTNPLSVPTGSLKARAKQHTDDKPCVVTPQARFRRLENQLYRVEIHQGGNEQTATFKFSRDNGSVVSAWLPDAANPGASDRLKLTSLGRDSTLGFSEGQFVELIDDTRELAGQPGDLHKIITTFPDSTSIQLDATVDIANFPRNPRVRRWDQTASALLSTAPAVAGDFVDLEDGVQVQFQAGSYSSGDYWLIPARTISADVVWPTDSATNPLALPRAGIEHRSANLATVHFDGTRFTFLGDCRKQFPPLTDIWASDVRFDNGVCQFPAAPTTVQKAIEQLCKNKAGGCCCGVQIGPADDAQTMIDNALSQNEAQKIDALSISFAAGTYHFTKPLNIIAPKTGSGDVTVQGCGAMTRILVSGQEVALNMVGWATATATDMALSADTASPPIDPGRLHEHLGGVVTFSNCGTVRAERLSLTCAAGFARAATCLTVSGSALVAGKATAAVWVRDCQLQTGHLQTGILIVNAARATVENNRLATAGVAAEMIKTITTSAEYLSRYRRLALRDVQLGGLDEKLAPEAGLNNHQFAINGTKVLFRADTALGNAWNGIISNEVPRAFQFLQHTKLPVLSAKALKSSTDTLAATRHAETLPTAAPELAVKRAEAATTALPLPAAAVPTATPPVSGQAKIAGPTTTAKGTKRDVAHAALKVKTRLEKMTYAILNAVSNPNAPPIKLSSEKLAPFSAWIGGLQAAFSPCASAGIVIAGANGGDLRVTDNTISDALDGIHLGFSVQAPRGTSGMSARRVQVTGNTVTATIPNELSRGAHAGIFVGNCQSVVIQRNSVQMTGARAIATAGIRLYGNLGNMAVISQNDVTATGVAIVVHPMHTIDGAQWRVSENYASGSAAFDVTAPVSLADNKP
jgi:hypothetical protein